MEFLTKVVFFAFAISFSWAGPLFKPQERQKRSSDTVEFHLLNRDALKDENIHTSNDYTNKMYSEDTMFNYHHDCEKPVTDYQAMDYKRSMCPWVYHTKNTQLNRFPSIIPEAQLRCNTATKACLGLNSNQTVDYECAPVTKAVDVWYTNPDVGDDVYEHREEHVTVGYTCAAKKVKSTHTDSGIFKK